ncbi:MAG: tRNA (adenine-N1)-methyltransferase [Chloroflexi bacterium]|nr:tRNA (adenine-N1)-methyltransferase [Chloroflexota bacterium]
MAAGETILLVDERLRRYTVHLRPGATFHFHRGYFAHDDLIGAPEGTAITSSRGAVLIALRPTLAQYVLEMPRRTQIIYPKDLALILLWADIFPGARVFESGIGSGALTLALLRAAGPTGHVVTYEQRAEFIAQARRNIERFHGPAPNLSVHERDVYEGIAEGHFDRLVLDVPEPWQVVEAAAAALRPGGIVLSYSPTIIQAQRTAETLRAQGDFALVDTVETLLRPWHIVGQSVRPVHRMVAHTGFIITARRLAGRLPPRFAAAAQADLPSETSSIDGV